MELFVIYTPTNNCKNISKLLTLTYIYIYIHKFIVTVVEQMTVYTDCNNL
jgi:hypothetical protein